jgi:dienelactone hydrolase
MRHEQSATIAELTEVDRHQYALGKARYRRLFAAGKFVMAPTAKLPSTLNGTPVGRSEVEIPPLGLAGILKIPAAPRGFVVFVHGSGSSRLSPRNSAVADAFAKRNIATLLFDLLTIEEEDDRTRVFDIPLLADRLTGALNWVGGYPPVKDLPLGLFGASTGAAAALVAAAELGDRISAVVSRGGRPDLAGSALPAVRAPTLLIVGGADNEVIRLNEQAFSVMKAEKALEIVPGATHLFAEPGALDAVIALAAQWFLDHFGRAERRRNS